MPWPHHLFFCGRNFSNNIFLMVESDLDYKKESIALFSEFFRSKLRYRPNFQGPMRNKLLYKVIGCAYLVQFISNSLIMPKSLYSGRSGKVWKWSTKFVEFDCPQLYAS